MFCPFVKGNCNSDCVFHVQHNRTGDSKCRIEAAIVNLEYLGDFVSTHEAELQELIQDHKCSDTAVK